MGKGPFIHVSMIYGIPIKFENIKPQHAAEFQELRNKDGLCVFNLDENTTESAIFVGFMHFLHENNDILWCDRFGNGLYSPPLSIKHENEPYLMRMAHEYELTPQWYIYSYSYNSKNQ